MLIGRILQWPAFKDPRTLWRGSGVFLVLSLLLLSMHIVEVRRLRDVGLPLATLVPDIEKRLRILDDQVELARLHAATNRGAPEEFVHVYILPDDIALDRLIASFEMLHDVLKREGSLLSMTPINIGEKSTEGELSRWPVSFTVRTTEEGLNTISLFLSIAGFFTVADVLTERDIRQLLLYAESENPVGIVALEQFLSADLLSYAGEYQALMDMVGKSFVSPAFDRLFTGLQEESLLKDVRMLLQGPIGERLRNDNLWPLRFMTVDTVTINTREDGTKEAAFQISAYSRM